jgi:hypothetical protein
MTPTKREIQRTRKIYRVGIKNLNKQLKDVIALEKAIENINKWQEGSVIRLRSIGFISSLQNVLNYIPIYTDELIIKRQENERKLRKMEQK